RMRMLDDVREGFLDNAIERRLRLRGQALVSKAGLEAYGNARLRAEGLRQALERGPEAEVVEHLRPQLDCQAPDVVQRRDDELAHVRDGSARIVAFDLLLERLQTEQDRRQRLAGLVVQLTREPPALELLRSDDAAKRVARDPLREIDCNRRARSERLCEAQVVVGEA